MVPADLILPELWADEAWGQHLDDEARAALIAGVEAWIPAGAHLQEATVERLRAGLVALGELSAALPEAQRSALVPLCLAAWGARPGAPW